MNLTSAVLVGSIPRLCMTRSTWSLSFFVFRFCFLAEVISAMSLQCFFERMAANELADDDCCGSSACIQWCFWTIDKVKRFEGSRTNIRRTKDSQSKYERNDISSKLSFLLYIKVRKFCLWTKDFNKNRITILTF